MWRQCQNYLCGVSAIDVNVKITSTATYLVVKLTILSNCQNYLCGESSIDVNVKITFCGSKIIVDEIDHVEAMSKLPLRREHHWRQCQNYLSGNIIIVGKIDHVEAMSKLPLRREHHWRRRGRSRSSVWSCRRQSGAVTSLEGIRSSKSLSGKNMYWPF